MTPFQKGALSFLSVAIVALSGSIIWIFKTRWQRPLGPPLDIPTSTSFSLPATWTPDPRIAKTASPPSAVPSPTSTATPSPICGETPLMNILLIGSDSRSDAYRYGLADMIRIARVDFITGKVTVLDFPRDMWVEIPDIADNLKGQDHEKLNQAYLYGNPGFNYVTDPTQGPGLLARTLALNFGTAVGHYAAVNMQTVVNVVNAVGGVDVFLPKSVDGRTAEDLSSRLYFPEGVNHLDGRRALTLARIRIKGGFARAENQNRVLCALRAKLVTPAVVKDIPDLIQSFKDNIQTDLSLEQIGDLACLGTKMKPADIRFVDFPKELFYQTRQYDPVFGKDVSILKVDFAILRDYVAKFNAGTWPPAIALPAQRNQEEVSFCQ